MVRRLRRTIGGVAIGGLVWASVAAAQDIPTPPSEVKGVLNPVPRDEDNLRAGTALYERLCAGCHGRTGAGDGPVAKRMAWAHRPPDFSSVLTAQSDGEVFWKIARGGGAMPAYGTSLSDTERWQVIHYLRALTERR